MSIEQVKKAAAEQKGDYVKLPGAILAAALQEANEQPKPGSLAAHVADRLEINPDAVMHVHRTAHLGKLLGVPAAAAKPGKPALET